MYMTKLRATLAIGLSCCGAMLVVKAATAQIPLPEAKPPDGPTLFKQQCAVCHTGIVGRRAGSVDGFHYSPAFAKADFTWDDARLDAWMTNPQQMIPGAVMAYRQARPEVRTAIIAYLKELH